MTFGKPVHRTTYERTSDQLRVIVTDTPYPDGIERLVTASRPGGIPTVSQEREVRRLFLRSDRQVTCGRGITNPWVRSFRQALDGVVDYMSDPRTPFNQALVDMLIERADLSGKPIDVRGEQVVFWFEERDGWWAYSFLRAGQTTSAAREFQHAPHAIAAAVMHYESDRAGVPDHVAELIGGRPVEARVS